MRRPCRADLKTSSSPVRTEAGHRISLRGEIQALRSREAVEGEHLSRCAPARGNKAGLTFKCPQWKHIDGAAKSAA